MKCFGQITLSQTKLISNPVGHQVSFFTTHNADGDAYFPVHHVTSCLHCGTRLEDYSSEDVEVHVVGPEELTEQEESDLVAELKEKAPRGGFFQERWGWGQKQSELHQPVATYELADENPDCDRDKAEQRENPSDFFVYRRGDRVGKVGAAVLEEAAYRCPALARALGWDGHDGASQAGSAPCEAAVDLVAEELGDQSSDENHDDPTGGAP